MTRVTPGRLQILAALAGVGLAAAACSRPAAPRAAWRAPSEVVPAVSERTYPPPVLPRSALTFREARRQIEDGGHGHITGLREGKDGLWRASAWRNGARFRVAINLDGALEAMPV